MISNLVKTHSKIEIFIIFLLLIYSFFGYLFPDKFSYLILIFSLFVLMINLIINKKRAINVKQFTIFCLIIIFIFIQFLQAGYSLYPNSSVNISITRSIILLIGFLICIQYCWFEKGIKYIFIFSMVHIIATLFSFLLPSIFQGIILPLLPESVGIESIKFLSNGIYAGITEQVGRNAFYISVGLSIIYSILIVKSKELNRLKMCLLIALLTLFLLTLLLTGKRGHLIANLFSFLIVSVIYTKIKGKSVIIKILWMLIGIFILIYFITIIFPEAAAPFLRFLERQGGDQTSGRIELYLYALDLFKEKPIVGWGVGTFSNLYGMGNHNIYLQLLSENGIIGFISFVSILIYNFYNTIYELKKNYYLKNTINYKYLIFSLYNQLFFLIYGMTGNPLNDGFILIMYFLAASIPYISNLRTTASN